MAASQREVAAGREYYELRLYHQRRGVKTKMMDDS